MLDRETRALLASRSNPVFEVERQKISWLHDGSSLARLSRRIWVTSAFGALLIWIIIAASNNTLLQDKLVLALIYLAFIVTAVVDLYNAFTSANDLHRQITSKQWQLIRISGLSKQAILSAQYAMTQIRVWRFLVIEVALRIVVSVLFLLSSLRYWSVPQLTEIPQTPILILPLGCMLVVCILEPIWRAGTINALSMAVVGVTKSSNASYFFLFTVITIIHALQAATFAYVWSTQVIPFIETDNGFFTLLICAYPLGVILSFCGTYPIYEAIRRYSLYTARKTVFTPID